MDCDITQLHKKHYSNKILNQYLQSVLFESILNSDSLEEI